MSLPPHGLPAGRSPPRPSPPRRGPGGRTAHSDPGVPEDHRGRRPDASTDDALPVGRERFRHRAPAMGRASGYRAPGGSVRVEPPGHPAGPPGPQERTCWSAPLTPVRGGRTLLVRERPPDDGRVVRGGPQTGQRFRQRPGHRHSRRSGPRTVRFAHSSGSADVVSTSVRRVLGPDRPDGTARLHGLRRGAAREDGELLSPWPRRDRTGGGNELVGPLCGTVRT